MDDTLTSPNHPLPLLMDRFWWAYRGFASPSFSPSYQTHGFYLSLVLYFLPFPSHLLPLKHSVTVLFGELHITTSLN
jgi:hypothetical protein